MITVRMTNNGVGNSIRDILNAIKPNSIQRVLMEVGHDFQRMAQSNFGSNGRYRGAAWAPLSKAYAAQVGHLQATDKRTGALYHSIQVRPASRNKVNVYSVSPYGASVAFGDKKRNLPPRNFWPTEIIGTPMQQRLVLNADRDLYALISRRLNILSHGALPYQTLTQRSTIDAGNPFTI